MKLYITTTAIRVQSELRSCVKVEAAVKATCDLYFSLLKLIQQFLSVHYLKLYKPLDNLITYVTLVENCLGLVRHTFVPNIPETNNVHQ